MQKYIGLDYNGKITQVEIGDVAIFEDDFEECGEIVDIKPHGANIMLVLHNESGFMSDHIEGETATTILLRDCWIQ